ncbi:MAG TPA: hypothetical protein VMU02_00410, partial [bacterium]|nr:hypothetical protein [bacterium]
MGSDMSRELRWRARRLAIALAALAAIAGCFALSCGSRQSDEVVFWQFQPPEVMAELVKQF